MDPLWPFKHVREPAQIIQCRAHGVFFADYSLRSVSITNNQENALRFTKEGSAQVALDYMRAAYGSFDWQAVPVEG